MNKLEQGEVMILSISRRTDIPAFYGEWLYNRLQAGFLKTRNPYNPNQVKTIDLAPAKIDCLVFWTKDPAALQPYLQELKEYTYYFLFTLNSYPSSIEQNLRPLEKRIRMFQELSRFIGAGRVIWRYDPVLFCNGIELNYHLQNFSYLAERLAGFTEKCIFSFLDLYKKTVRNMKNLGLIDLELPLKRELAEQFQQIASRNNIKLATCSEPGDYSDLDIAKAKCIDRQLIERLSGKSIKTLRDPNQRSECDCCKSVDIGAYNSCKHACLYCYASSSPEKSAKYFNEHDIQAEYM